MEYFFVVLVSFFGSLIQRVTGFGFGIFAMMFLPHLLGSYKEANALTGMLSLLSCLVVCAQLFRLVDWKNLILPSAASIIFSWLAVRFVSGQEDELLKALLGVFLIFLSVYFMFFSHRVHIKPSWYAGLVSGGLSGILGGLFATGGPPVVLYFMESEKDVNRYFATIQAYFAITNLFSTTVKAASGFVTGSVLVFWLFGSAGMLAGIWAGKLVYGRLSADLIKKLVYAMMAASGAVNIVMALL
ncbi:MAG: sulfite exporter TauE/SafE family protein [Eubacteriales bacterium]|jgi:uncharacterized membrane protein YfcA